MKEKDLLKSATDLQMPDLEQIRQNVLNSANKPQDVKPKIIKLKPSRLIAVAAIVALAVIGTIAAVANPNGILFPPATEATTTPTETQPLTSAPKQKKTSSKAESATAKKLSPSELRAKNAKKYKNRLNSSGFSVSSIFDLGKIEGYHIVYAGNGITSKYDCDHIIGDYTFRTHIQQNPYALGLYACGKEHSYTLADSYTKNIFEDFSAVVNIIKDHADLNLGLEIVEKDAVSESFRNYFGGKDILSLSKLSSNDNCELYYNVPESAKQSSKGKIIEDYNFILNAEQEPYDLGLYVVSGGNIATLEDAVKNGTLGMDEAYDAMKELAEKGDILFVPEEEETEEATESVDDEEEITEEE